MIYRHDSWGWGNLPDQVYEYLSNFIPDITYAAATGTMTFFDKFAFTIVPNNNWPTLSLTYGSNRIEWGAEAMYREKDVYFVLTDDFMQLKIYFPNYGQRWMIISYIKTADGRYYAGGSVNSQTEYTIYNTPYYDIQDALPTYFNFPKILNFGAVAGKVVYAEQTPLVYNNTSIEYFDTIYCCSTVPIRSTVSIGNDNYFALDTNNLILIPNE